MSKLNKKSPKVYSSKYHIGFRYLSKISTQITSIDIGLKSKIIKLNKNKSRKQLSNVTNKTDFSKSKYV